MSEIVSEKVSQRIVPGAPPAALKTQRKKRKGHQKSLADSPAEQLLQTQTSEFTQNIVSGSSDPESAAIVQQESSTAASGVVVSQAAILPEDDFSSKPRPITQLINKRLKATTKKIRWISSYAAIDPDKLDEDQKRNIGTLPALEAIQKELVEIKKAVETCESEQAQEFNIKRQEAERAEKQRIAEAVSASETANLVRTSEIFDIFRLRSLLTSGQIEDFAESQTIYGIAEAIIEGDSEARQVVVKGFLSGKGEFEGVSYARILDFTRTSLAPRAPSPIHEEDTEDAVVATKASEVSETSELEGDISRGVGDVTSAALGIHFMQESELEAAEVPVFEGLTQEHCEPTVSDKLEPKVNGYAQDQEIEQPSGGFDWATDEDSGLPSINSLHAKFGTSGNVTPEDVTNADNSESFLTPAEPIIGESDVTQLPSSTSATGINNSHPNSYDKQNWSAPAPDEDGFKPAHGGRTTGSRGVRGEGRPRTSFRGRYHSGGGSGQGSDRRGGFRSGDRGGHRGSERTGFKGRGDWRADGEYRWRGGRGRGRGEYRPQHQPSLATSAA